ncbi:uncharacterized protein LOC126382234 isoform X2 [Pectinophora gossypiella]|uniref:uncharacterized protein LOC126382234 isoform X2 n=1 Tax=Pectinophora gossypiella TaxID=13191 RepID=UPI00214E78DE|nr:uncharacterized protein LOC126382234 isoform X2 [Pectinophora gossypiella]
MHMWMWFGYDLGEFLFPGLTISSRWSFALTWIVLFFVALLFEGSKVYLARVQRDAHKKLYPFRSDERRNLLCDRMLVNTHQSLIFLIHNVVGYLLMLAVMVYNVHLLLAVVFGMMLGYFLFGPKLTRLQMQCFSTRKTVICTPECDDTAENTTPPLLDSSLSSESDFFICRTRTCIQPSHYFPANRSADGTSNDLANATCYYGAKKCPSRVARARRMQERAHCSHESEKEDSPSVEDAQLLRTERQGCCKKKQEPPPQEKKCCKKSSQTETVVVHESKCCKEESEKKQEREDSPQITCCHSAMAAPSESQEQIIK